jgi:starch synthase
MSRLPGRLLFCASEFAPLVKTGGLADVAGSLPAALRAAGIADVTVAMPAYADALAVAAGLCGGSVDVVHAGVVDGIDVRVHAWQAAGGVRVLLVDVDGLFADRAGNPYHDAAGVPWPDSGLRFGRFCRAVAALADGAAGEALRTDIVHANDWQCGLLPVFLQLRGARARSVFTVHNLAYAGLFPASLLAALGIPGALYTPDALEFHGEISFIKGGLAFADRLTTVSPCYAREIATPEFGCGLDGLVRHRQGRLDGILNGIDERLWDPAADPLIAARYDAASLPARLPNRQALAHAFGIDCDAATPCVGVVGRLAWQKGVDLLLDAIDGIVALPCRVAVLGDGDRELVARLSAAAARHPGRVGFVAGFDERRAHLLQAGADVLAVPSRYEPCGLTQLFALHYGCVPVAHRTGGLADSIVDVREDPAHGTGLLFDDASPQALHGALAAAAALFRDAGAWAAMQRRGMAVDVSWAASARRYLDVYARALAVPVA